MNESRINWIRRSWIGLQELDSTRRFGCRVEGVTQLVEGEIVRLSPEHPDDPARPRQVLASRIDPGYMPGRWPNLETYTLSGNDPFFAPYHGFVEHIPREVREQFQARTYGCRRAKERPRVVRICRRVIEEHPLYLDPYWILGEIEWFRGRREKARKYLETGWKIGQLAFPRGFTGTFDGRNGQNLSVHCVGTSYAKILADFGREEEAIEILRFLALVDRLHGFNRDGIDLPILLRAGRAEHVRAICEGEAPLGPGEFVRALVLFAEGRETDAVRAVCRGMPTNPLFVSAILASRKRKPRIPLQEGREYYAYQAELHVALLLPAWRERGQLPRLARLAEVPVFAKAAARAAEVARRFDGREGLFVETDPFDDIRQCFSERVVEETVRAAAR